MEVEITRPLKRLRKGQQLTFSIKKIATIHNTVSKLNAMYYSKRVYSSRMNKVDGTITVERKQ
jgi:hypothetical protein